MIQLASNKNSQEFTVSLVMIIIYYLAIQCMKINFIENVNLRKLLKVLI